MSHTITVRLNKELAEWLEEASKKSGVSQGQLVRDQLAKAKDSVGSRRYMRWAGYLKNGPKDLSMRKGYSKG